MERSRGKSPGWAAFDRKQRQKQGQENDIISDPYPPVSNESLPSSNFIWNQSPLRKSFSSVVQPALNFQNPLSMSKGGENMSNNAMLPLERLKNIHSWASEDLIQDILAASDNDVEQAFAILSDMASSDLKEEKSEIPGKSSVSLEVGTLPGESRLPLNTLRGHLHEEFKSKASLSVPTEPEWEEDDIYSILRKDAIRTMRLASHHSQAAKNAFLRGDHFSAQKHSLKAQEEWGTAERLNAIAAKEILTRRNANNDLWKFDLHGLHASEASNALKERLLRIEADVILKPFACDDITKRAEGVGQCSLSEPDRISGREARAGKQQIMLQQRAVLHVITGTGNHSHGQAALPAAIKSFLIENGYRFEEVRPGVFAVRPKFRLIQT